VKIIEDEGGEAVALDFIDIFLYGMYSKNFNYRTLAGTRKRMILNNLAIRSRTSCRSTMTPAPPT
jgi:predicted nucleotide-binding protein (sugar kinase/HSP70/actin superfamily)